MLKARLIVLLPAPIHVATVIQMHFQEHATDGPKLTEGDVFKETKTVSFDFDAFSFGCHLDLHLDQVSNPLSVKHYWHGAQKVTLTLCGENYSPEDIYTERWAKTREVFVRAAFDVLYRLISFCRYELGYPFMRPINISNVEHTEWLDDSDAVVKIDGDSHVLDFFPGIRNTRRSLGSQYLTPHLQAPICDALASGVDASIQQELLAFARDSIYEGHALKAVLMMAVAAEVAIKTTFFHEDSLAAVAFDYLEEKRQVEISTKELIDKVAKRVGGCSFADYDSAAFHDIDHLFRCRNKVAHRARAEYKDDAGRLHIADDAKLYSWWQSVERLLFWLPTLRVQT